MHTASARRLRIAPAADRCKRLPARERVAKRYRAPFRRQLRATSITRRRPAGRRRDCGAMRRSPKVAKYLPMARGHAWIAGPSTPRHRNATAVLAWSGSKHAGSVAGRAECEVAASVAMTSVVHLVRQSNRSECSAKLRERSMARSNEAYDSATMSSSSRPKCAHATSVTSLAQEHLDGLD